MLLAFIIECLGYHLHSSVKEIYQSKKKRSKAKLCTISDLPPIPPKNLRITTKRQNSDEKEKEKESKCEGERVAILGGGGGSLRETEREH